MPDKTDLHTFKLLSPRTLIIDVIDGDTVKAFIDRSFDDYSKRGIRINGINTPEKNRIAEKIAGIPVKQIMQKWIEGKDLNLIVQSKNKGKYYGRFVGDVWFEDEDGNKQDWATFILENGLGKPYTGRGAKEFTPEELHDCMVAIKKFVVEHPEYEIELPVEYEKIE